MNSNLLFTWQNQNLDRTDTDSYATPIYVRPFEGNWGVFSEGEKQPELLFDLKQNALSLAKLTAQQEKTIVVLHKSDGSLQSKFSYKI